MSKRIKSISATATAPAADDYLPIDGNTNGTRKILISRIPIVVTVPASATATGTAGTIAYDGDYFYSCIATDTWRRAALMSW